jgi:hypothetical protein
MTLRTKVHDGIIALLVLTSAALTWLVDPRFIALAGLTALVMLSSTVTGFCPVHWAVSKTIDE